MALVVKIQGPSGSPFQGVDNGQSIEYVFGVIVATGSYVTGGDTLSFAGSDLLKSGGSPFQMQIWSQGAGGGSGYLYGYVPGTTQGNGKMQVFQSAAAGNPHTELAAGAYPAGITGDTIAFSAMFVRI